MRGSNWKIGAAAFAALAMALTVATPSWSGGAVSAVTKKSPNVAQLHQRPHSQQAASSVEFSSSERTSTSTTTRSGAKWK